MQKFLRPNFLAGLFFFSLGLLAILVLIPYGVDEPSNVQYRALAPSYWPRIVCMSLVILGFAILARSVVRIVRGTEVEEDDGTEYIFWRAVVVIAGGFVLYSVIEWLGFVLSCTIALVFMMLLAGERRPHIIAPVALGIPLLLHFFFTKAASIPIPGGILEPLLARL